MLQLNGNPDMTDDYELGDVVGKAQLAVKANISFRVHVGDELIIFIFLCFYRPGCIRRCPSRH